MNTNYNYRNLGCAIVLQATKDYFESTPAMQRAILKDLRSGHLSMLSDGISLTVADELESNPKEIAIRLKRYKEEFN